MKKEVYKMFLIVLQIMSISFVILLYLWQHFNYSFLLNEIREIRQAKRKILTEIEEIHLESSKYSSVHRIESLFSDYSSNTENANRRYKQNRRTTKKITTLKIPSAASIEKSSESRIIQYKW